MEGTKQDYWPNEALTFNSGRTLGSPTKPVTLNWLAQLFTPQGETAYQITSVRLPLSRSGDNDYGDLVVSIRDTALNVPVFSDLVVGSIPSTSIPIKSPFADDFYTWLEIPFDSTVALYPGHTYAIVFRVPYSTIPYDSHNAVRIWGRSDTPSPYPYAYASESYDGGFTWNDWSVPLYEGTDWGFQVWGVDIAIWIAPLVTFPPSRSGDYEPDDFWIPGEWNGDVYTPPEWAGPTPGRYFATGGGRWGLQLVAVGHGLVYYEELT